ncbi:MAG: PLP-dependent aminotransferase family protein [Lachnospiraceae bacterium]
MKAYDLSKRGKLTLYEYLYECLKKDILEGRIATGEKLPSKRELAGEYGISVKTVENAYAQLLTEGYLEAEEKRGYFAARVERADYHKKAAPVAEIHYNEEKWFADFTSSNTVYARFPFSQWSKVMRETLSYRDRELLQTAPFQGVRELREAIAEYLYRNRGMSVSPDCILIGAGTEYLYGRLLELLAPAGVYAVEDPGYQKIARIYKGQGMNFKYIPVDGEGVCMDALRESGADVVHVSPGYHFPLGFVMPVGRRQELLSWAAETPERYIIEDDYDCEFRYSGRPVPSIQSMDRHHRVIYMNTFSKTLAPSIRISYMVLPRKLMDRYVEKMNYYSNTVSNFEQYALAAFMEEGYFERHISRMRKYYREYRDRIKQYIKETTMPVIEMSGIDAGTRLLVKVDTSLTDSQIKWAAREAGIRLECLSEFCHEKKPAYENVLILNYADLKEEVLKEAILQLAHIFTP